MNNCIFCKIIARQEPAEILFEDEKTIAILDLNPINYGHSLIIPKVHCKEFVDLPEEYFSSLLGTAKIIACALIKAFNLEGYNLISNNGSIAGQSVFHFHLHITPRYRDDNIKVQLQLKSYKNGEMNSCANKVRQFIQQR